MGYKVTERLHYEIKCEAIEFNSDMDIPCKIHGSYEWIAEEFMGVLNLGEINKGNIYISGTKNKAFKVEEYSITEIPIDQYIGQNTIISNGVADKLKKILSRDVSEKYYINSCKDKIHIQNWDKTFKIEVNYCKAIMNELIMYNNYTGIDYEIININIIKHRAIEKIRMIMLSSGEEKAEVRLIKDANNEYTLKINNEDIDIYSAVVSSNVDDNDIILYIDIKSVYKMIEQCESAFVALDITYLDEKSTGGIALRVAEIDLDKYEDAYNNIFNNISHFDMRNELYTIEHLEMRDECLNRKCYAIF